MSKITRAANISQFMFATDDKNKSTISLNVQWEQTRFDEILKKAILKYWHFIKNRDKFIIIFFRKEKFCNRLLIHSLFI